MGFVLLSIETLGIVSGSNSKVNSEVNSSLLVVVVLLSFVDTVATVSFITDESRVVFCWVFVVLRTLVQLGARAARITRKIEKMIKVLLLINRF